MTAGSNCNAFNAPRFRQLQSEIGEAGAIEVLRVFLHDAKERVRTIHGSLSENNPALIMREAHAIKSSSATFGFERLSMEAQRLEGIAPILDARQTAAAVERIVIALMEADDIAMADILAA